MSLKSDWDVEKYREEYESDKHWELRKKFMVTHKTKFPEDRLVCLAQVFFNVEFLGCRYPEKTMQLVAELSKGVADEHRAKQIGKLKRTFVQASDAAGAKVKGINSPACSTDLLTTLLSHSKKRFKQDTQSNRAFIKFCPAKDNYQNRDSLPDNSSNINFSNENSEKRIKKGTGPFADTVIFSSRDENPLSTIASTCSINKVKYSVQTTNTEDGRLYPEKTMGIVAELPYGRADEHRGTENENMISVVKALDAADAEVKEVKSLACPTDLTQPCQANKHFKSNTYSSADNNNLCPDQGNVSDVDFKKEKSVELNIKKLTGPFADIVILNGYQNTNPHFTFKKTCKANNAKFSIETTKTLNGKFKSEIFINGQVLCTAVESFVKTSKLSALELGLETLSASCYTVQEKRKIILQPVVITNDTESLQNTKTIDLPADNIGVKMMKLMGWGGNQGLGKASQGISTPIEPVFNVVRAGLGKSNVNDLRRKFSPIFSQFANSESEDDLVFSTECTEEDRKFLQKLAQEYKLKAKYRLNAGERCFVVSNPKKPQCNMWRIVKELLETENMESENYRLIEPSSFLNRNIWKEAQ